MPHSETIIDGIWYPSVTTIMDSIEKPWVVAWQQKWGQRAVNKLWITQAIGTEVHRCVEEYLNGREYVVQVPVREDSGKALPTCLKRTRDMVTAFVTFLETLDGEITATEKKVVSKKYFYSGTMDAKGKLTRECIARLENKA